MTIRSSPGLTRIAVAALFSAVAAGAPAGAQGDQFTAPGTLSEDRPDQRERVEQGLAAAEWNLGRMRIDRGAWIRDLGYVSNVFSESDGSGRKVSDLRARIGAGLVSFLHLGPDVVLTLFGRPEYNFWLEEDELRELDTSYGAGLFGLYNRATIGLEARRDETERFLNDETRVPVNLGEDSLRGEFELDFRGPLNLFGMFRRSDIEHARRGVPGVPAGIDRLDREEQAFAVGLEIEIGSALRIGVGLEEFETTFQLEPERRSFVGQSPMLRVRLTGNRIELEALAVARELDFAPTADLPDGDETLGMARLRIDLGSTTSVTPYYARNLVYSALDEGAAFVDETLGATLRWEPRERWSNRFFLETGSNRFLVGRTDDLQSVGASTQYQLRQNLRLRLGFETTDVQSDLDQFDRSFSQVITEIALTSEVLDW